MSTDLDVNVRLTGNDLLTTSRNISKQRSFKDQRDLAIGCGYVKLDSKGRVRADMIGYNNALSVAEKSLIKVISLENGDLSITMILFDDFFSLNTTFNMEIKEGKIILSPIIDI